MSLQFQGPTASATVYYTARRAGTWVSDVQVPFPTTLARAATLAVTADGSALIAAQDVLEGKLYLARNDAGRFAVELVDDAQDVGRFAALALVGDTPHLVYFDAFRRRLRHARRGEHGWTRQTVDAAEGAGMHTAIAVDDAGGALRVVYQAGADGQLGERRLASFPCAF